jgi:tetratricopeptide (TPR) repeat protein
MKKRLTILIILVATILTSCSKHAKDIDLTDLNAHREYQDNSTEDLASEYKELLENNPNSGNAHYLYARAAKNSLSNEERLVIVISGLKIDGDNYELNNYTGILYNNESSYKKAITYLEKCIKIDNDRFFAHYNLALSYNGLSDNTSNLEQKKSFILKAIECWDNSINTKDIESKFVPNAEKARNELKGSLTELEVEIEQQTKCKAIAGFWTGKQVMGSAMGFAGLTVAENCNCAYEYKVMAMSIGKQYHEIERGVIKNFEVFSINQIKATLDCNPNGGRYEFEYRSSDNSIYIDNGSSRAELFKQ